MKPPPLLLGVTLLFWGWQSDLLIVGTVMAVLVEGHHFIKARWDFSDEDFSRVWTLCSLLTLAAVVYAFVDNQGPSSFAGFFQNGNPTTQRAAGSASARTAFAMFRWLPMIYFPFILAQFFSTREAVPWKAISFFVQRRFKRAQQAGQPAPPVTSVNLGMAYFAMAIIAAAAHPPENKLFYWGLSGLLAWALWSQRSRRFSFSVWITALVVAVALGFVGQRGIGQAVRLMENFNPQWLANFIRRRFDAAQSNTSLGQIGDVKTSGNILIRLEPKKGSAAPTYLREASYRFYKDKSCAWQTGANENEFTTLSDVPVNSFNWPLPTLQRKTNTSVVSIGCYLEGSKALLPLPDGCAQLNGLYLVTLRYNPFGAVLGEGAGFVLFDADFGPGATIDSAPDTNDVSNIPAGELPALEKITDELKLDGLSAGEKLTRVQGFFSDKFTYSTWQRAPKSSDTNSPLTRFLLTTRSGHCEYFASATVLLLRHLNIPARYAVGFYCHETIGDGYVVRASDAHAWTLVWDETARTWKNFDTTPASWVETESKHSAWQWFADARSRIGFEIRKLFAGQTKLREYLLWAIVPGVIVLIYQIVFKRRGRKKNKSATELERADWPGLDSEFYLLEKKLAAQGVPREPGETLSEWLKRLAQIPALNEVREPLGELLRLHYRHRFDPAGLVTEEREALRQNAKLCLEKIGRTER